MLYKINELKVKVYHMTQQHKRVGLSIEHTWKYRKQVLKLRIKLFFSCYLMIIIELDNTSQKP